MVLYAATGLVRVMKGCGQGGARLEEGSAEAHLTGGLADNSHWLFGVIYVNRGDPSIMVESRFGIGYTFNFGNLTALLLNAAYLLLLLGLVAAAVVGSVF